MSKRYNALVAINGGGYVDVSPNGKTGGTGGKPVGIIIADGKVAFPTEKEKYNEQYCAFV